jgi:hypothetical protein
MLWSLTTLRRLNLPIDESMIEVVLRSHRYHRQVQLVRLTVSGAFLIAIDTHIVLWGSQKLCTLPDLPFNDMVVPRPLGYHTGKSRLYSAQELQKYLDGDLSKWQRPSMRRL